VDNRITLNELKLKIAELLNLDTDKFLMKYGGRLGTELKDLQNKLADCKITNITSIYLELGTPSRSGEYRVRFSLGAISPENVDGLVYEFEELFEWLVSNMEKVKDLKEKVVEELRKMKNIRDLTSSRLRLRERNSDSLGAVLHNEKLLKDYTLYDKKVFVVEILEEDDTSKSSQILVILKKWDIMNFELSMPKQIFISKDNTTMNDFGVLVSSVFDIALENLEASNVRNLWKFSKPDLLIEDGRWEKLSGNSNKTCNYPWFLLKDGPLIVIRDTVMKIDNHMNPNIDAAVTAANDKAKKIKKGLAVQFNFPETSLKIGVKKNNESKKKRRQKMILTSGSLSRKLKSQKDPMIFDFLVYYSRMINFYSHRVLF